MKANKIKLHKTNGANSKRIGALKDRIELLEYLNKVRTTPSKHLSIALSVCESFGVTLDEIKGIKKHRDLVEARMIISNVIRETCKLLSLEKIGDVINRDHATVMHHISRKYLLEGESEKVYKTLVKLYK